jgi:hypothetical protein
MVLDPQLLCGVGLAIISKQTNAHFLESAVRRMKILVCLTMKQHAPFV